MYIWIDCLNEEIESIISVIRIINTLPMYTGYQVLGRNLVFIQMWDFLFSLFTSRMIRWAGHVARMGEKRNAYKILVGKPEG
jgi:hypothetical protein